MLISPITALLDTLYHRYRPLTTGKVASYIPELTHADPNWFGLCIATRDGYVYEVGDTRQPFTIQSISKALTYGIALEDNGEAALLQKVGVEPSGEAFNAISLSASGVPFNPMINAGAIAVCGQVHGASAEEKIRRILDCFSRYAGRQLDIDAAVYHSESQTGHRNRAIGWMLRSVGILDGDPTPVLETYFQQCAIRVTCQDLALMAATLANAGINPRTGERALAQTSVDNVLSVMATCGMYNYAGEWLYQVGLPAKSGVGGGIMAVLPGQLGIALFSPLLDNYGNSVRGVQACIDLSRELALHPFHAANPALAALRLSYDATAVSSKYRRSAVETAALRRAGGCIKVFELQGELFFGTCEPVVRALVAAECSHCIVSLNAVTHLDTVSARLLAELALHGSQTGKILLFAQAGDWAATLRQAGVAPEALVATDDQALELCENQLLATLPVSVPPVVTLGDCALCAGLTPDELAYLDARLDRRTLAAGTTVIQIGQPANELFLLLRGNVQVQLPNAPDDALRLDVYTPGMTFGEMAFIDRSLRSAEVIALDEIDCRVITRTLFDALDSEQSALKITLLHNLATALAATVRRVNRELATLHG